MTLTRVTDRLFRLPTGIGQCYLWLDDREVTLIDSGVPGSADPIADALRSLGRMPGDVARVVLTHRHIDHVGSAAVVREWGAQVLVHAGDADAVRRPEPLPIEGLLPSEEALWWESNGSAPEGFVPAAPPCAVDVEPADGDEIPFGGGAVVVHGPGHTPGSIGVYLPHERILFTGDTIATVPDLGPVLGPYNVDRVEAARSFRRLAALDSEVVCVGHGEPIVSGAGDRLRAVTDLGPFAGPA